MTDRMAKAIAAGEDCAEAFALAERRAIVEWLREDAREWQKCLGPLEAEAVEMAADAIEAGAHLANRPKGK